MAKRHRTNRRSLSDAVEIAAGAVFLILIIEFLDYSFQLHLDFFGIVPRTAPGLVGIFLSPFLHANAAHLLANALPLFVLLALLFWDHRYHPEQALYAIWLGSGFGTWLIGRPESIHIGASSIVYGLVTYLIAAGWWMKSWRSFLVGVVVLIFYGGIFAGVIPQEGKMSWEGHLSGAIAGVWCASRLHQERKSRGG